MELPRAPDTIAAVASAPGAAGVGIVRISGPLVPAIAGALLGRAPEPRHAHFTAFRAADGSLIDRGLLLYFPAPASYTGEDVLELQGHGSHVLLDLLLRRACGLGARLARPGEFTERAFLNGKLDLAQAEAVADLVAARSLAAARAALSSMEGVFSDKVNRVLGALVAVRVQIEAAIDFPEEEIDFLADPRLARQLADVRGELGGLLQEARRGLRLTDGLRAAIVGRPNAGKSSLLNALAGRDRAIVTPIPGTTRDVLRETLVLDGSTLDLSDTAGLRDTEDVVEREGVRRAREELERADVAILVTDCAGADGDLELLSGLPPGIARVVLVNKIDRDGLAAREDRRDGVFWVWASARSGAGLDALRRHLRQLAGEGGGGAFSARRRHVIALERVALHLERATGAFVQACAGELAAEELREAQQELGSITGAYTSDDLLGAIFSSFCIGK